MENMMKKKLLIILTAVLLWVIPVAAVFSYSSLSGYSETRNLYKIGRKQQKQNFCTYIHNRFII